MILLCLFTMIFPTKIDFDHFNQIIIWNIGQGQWITSIDSQNCYHFDVGGEFFNSNSVSSACSKKKNIIFYSHWDWDHIGLTSKLRYTVNDLCIAGYPLGQTKDYKKKILEKIPLCKKIPSGIKKLQFSYQKSKNDNDLSHIYTFQNKFLIPGDSTKKMEKIWSPLLPKQIKWLSVSHHGSKTSTSEYFLSHTPNIRQAFVSARDEVYGHPHKVVTDRLKRHGISVLKTEDWGNIRLLYF